MSEQVQLAVLGSPIAHSKSPTLHAAAYRELGLSWNYGRHELVAAELNGFLASLSTSWRGLSLTMPLKREAFERCQWRDPVAEITGAVNTILFQEAGTIPQGQRGLGDASPADAGGSCGKDTTLTHKLKGYNTDVGGIVRALQRGGVTLDPLGNGSENGSGTAYTRTRVLLLGAGATAASALVASARLGASEVIAAVRNPERAADLMALAVKLGIPLTVITLEQARDGRALDKMGVNEMGPAGVGLVVNTIPGNNDVGLPVLGIPGSEGEVDRAAHEADYPSPSVPVPLFEVVYDPWPTRLAARWQQVAPVFSGLAMLVEQALLQVRIFVGGDPDACLPNENRVLEAMYRAVAPTQPDPPGVGTHG